MKALTVRQPWAWAIAHGGKNVENRTWYTAYRGPFAIHAALKDDVDGHRDHRILRAMGEAIEDADEDRFDYIYGALIAAVELVDVHSDLARSCDCGPWADPYAWHWVLADAWPLPEPIPATGRQGLWVPAPDLLAQIQAATP